MFNRTNLECSISANEDLTTVTVNATQTFNTDGYSIILEKEHYGEASQTLVIFAHVDSPHGRRVVTKIISKVTEEATFDIPAGCKHILVMDNDLQTLASLDI